MKSLHVLFGDASARAGARDRAEIHAQVLGQLARGRGGRDELPGRDDRGCLRGFGFGRGRRRGRSTRHAFGRFSGLGDDADHGLDRSHIPGRNDDLEEHAGRGCFHGIGDFVRLHLEKGFARLHALAFLLEPAGDLALLHGQPPFGHDCLVCHQFHLLLIVPAVLQRWCHCILLKINM
jgi:hypothetical protein